MTARYRTQVEPRSRGRVEVRSDARKLLNGRELIFGLAQGAACRFDRGVFERFVEMAVEFGATHIGVGWFPFRYGTWFLPDNRDPYASWCNAGLGLFRMFPPKALRRWIPLSSAREIQAVLETQMKIMRRYGLKGVVDGCEPLWLPEGVYRAHPHWRGAQCELGRIALRPYFAPSLDEPEVLDLYRETMKEIATRFPDIDQFSFMANDSGSGISWSPCIYPGMNGPTRWRTRDPGERIANWLKAMQEGAAAGGAKIRVNSWSSGLPSGTVASARAKLSRGQFVGWNNNHGEAFGGPGAGLGNALWSTYYPVVGLGSPVDFVAGLQGVYSNPGKDTARASISFEEANMPLARSLIESYLETPKTGLITRDQILLRAAERLSGSAAAAETLVSVWNEVKLADVAITKVQQKGFGLVVPWGCVSMRWLVRPLVPEPLKLTRQETAHYRSFLFSKDTDEENANLCRILGKPVFRGECAVWMARWALVDVVNRLTSSRARILEAAAKAKPEAASRLRLYAARLGAYACMAETARNTIMYQHALDVSDQPQFGPNMMDYDDNIVYDQRALVLRKIAREEVDNVAELLEILESEKGQVLQHARTPDEQSVFMMGPRLKADIRRKLDIMMDHWQDYETLFPSTKVWDFEPEPKGNIVGPSAGAEPKKSDN